MQQDYFCDIGNKIEVRFDDVEQIIERKNTLLTDELIHNSIVLASCVEKFMDILDRILVVDEKVAALRKFGDLILELRSLVRNIEPNLVPNYVYGVLSQLN
jgi:hypothetical protein